MPFKIGLSHFIKRLSLRSNLNLLDSAAKISKLSKFMVQLHSNRWSDIADWLMFFRHFLVRLEIPCVQPLRSDFLKVKLLPAYKVMHKFDIICVSESYLYPDFSSSDDNLNIPGYGMSRADYPYGNQHGGACIGDFAY